MSLRDNVEISTDATQCVQSMCEKAGVNLDPAVLPYGVDTMLGREFDGVDLSGGQWQRIAIARGIIREHKILLLDEPTAAIDPMQETLLYRQFAELAQGKTTVIATHRLGLVKICDKVVVMDKGCILDAGSHEELLERCGQYADMWSAQAQLYTNGAV